MYLRLNHNTSALKTKTINTLFYNMTVLSHISVVIIGYDLMMYYAITYNV